MCWVCSGPSPKHQLQAWSVVVSFSDNNTTLMRSWANGPPPRFDALVLATDNVARVTSLEQARQRPTLTALSAALHGCNGDLECVRVAIAVFRELPDPQRRRYTLTVLAALPEREFEIIEGELTMEERPDPLWRIEARSGLMKLWRRQVREEEREEALEEGRKEGAKEARKAHLVELILTVLEVRGVTVDDETSARIRRCRDLRKLERWARRAREVELAAELFTAT
jgi:hypothetical protein